MPYFGYSRYPMKVRTRSISRLVSWAFCSPSGRRRRRSSSRRSCSRASFRPCSKRRAPAPGSKFLTLPRINGNERGGVLAPARPRDVHLADAAHPVPVEVGLDGVSSLAPRPRTAASSSRKPSSSTCSRNSTSSGWGRITSATSRSASPISEVTLCGTDCDSLSAAFFSPSQSSSCSFSHQAASIAAMKVWWLRGSNSRRLSSCRSARMNSNSSGPDLPRMSCRRRARDSWVSAISSVTLAGSGSIGSGAATRGGRRRSAGTRLRRGGQEVVTFDHGLQRVPEQWIALAEELEQACPACRRGEDLGDVDEQPARRRCSSAAGS